MGISHRIEESDFENMNPKVLKYTILFSLTIPLVFFALKWIHP